MQGDKLTPNKPITAAMLAIGDELLSGRTRDANIQYLAKVLTLKGINLKEVRVVGDDSDAIADALNALRNSFDYVFTSGGIGPTHDDITCEAVAHAFGVKTYLHPDADKLLGSHYEKRQLDYTQARQKMACVPIGADLIDNPVSLAPGFKLDNVHVMAGVPAIFRAMLDGITDQLPTGIILQSRIIDCDLGEGTIGKPLAKIADEHPNVSIGSYPKFEKGKYATQIVIRSASKAAIDDAAREVEAMLRLVVSD